MSINSIGSSGAGAQESSGSTRLGKDEFLKLLMTQLSHQDPLSPMDSQAFVAQLAQFANVEQLQGMNTRMETMVMGQAAANQVGAANLVGRQVSYRTDTVQVAGGPVSLMGSLEKSATDVTAVIKDENGRTVRTLKLGSQNAGEFSAQWDGLDDSGQPVPPGAYKVSFTATDAGGNSLTVDSRGRGVVAGVTFERGYPELKVNGATLKMSDVLAIELAAS